MFKEQVKILSVFCFLLLSISVQAADNIYVRGIIRDSLTTAGLPYASIRFSGTDAGAVADDKGIFECALPDGANGLIASCVGYRSKTVPIRESSIQLYDIYLSPESTELQEVVVKKGKYSKRNNPAVEFAKRLKTLGPQTDPLRHDWYSHDRYERITLGLNEFDTTSQSAMLRRMPFLIEHVDTSAISGAPVLNLSLKEQAWSDLYRKNPKTGKKILRGSKSEGVDEIIDADNVQTILAELLPEIDLYDSSIKLLRNDFVSPLSAIAPDFYRFYLVDSAAVVGPDVAPCTVLAFYPRNKQSFGFSGHVYVENGDSLMPVRLVEMYTPQGINLNFVKALKIEQRYDKAPDGTRLKRKDNLFIEMEVLPGLPQLYVSRKIAYKNHSFDRPTDADSIFSQLGESLELEEAFDRDSLFWLAEQAEPLAAGESKTGELMDRLRRNKVFYWGEKFLRIMSSGYVATGKNSKFDIGPVNTIASYNSLEGLRLRAGGMTTANLSRHWFGRGYVAYGFRDHKWKYYGEAEYSFNEKKYHSREFPMHSLRLSHKYDVDRLGSHYLYTNADNFVLSLSRMSDRRFSYRRDTKLEYILELPNHLSFEFTLSHVRQECTEYLPFINGYGNLVPHYTQTSFEAHVRYAPGETFYQAKSFRIPIDETVPVFELSHRVSAAGFAGSSFTINRTEAAFSKLFRLSILGALETSLHGGAVWSKAPFPELMIPNANLSYTIQPASFALMNPMEFINSEYVALHATWHLRGALFNLIPEVRKLGLRETIGFHGLYGHLNRRNIPGADNPRLFMFPADSQTRSMNRPYMEVSAGLDNILRCLRLEYVWRLSYLDVPYKIDRRGLRVALHFTF